MEDKKLTLAPEVEEPETAEDTNELYIKFAKPYTFGDKTYTGIDLSGLEDVNGAVLKEAGRVVQKLNKGMPSAGRCSRSSASPTPPNPRLDFSFIPATS